MTIPDIKTIKTKGEAHEIVMEWQGYIELVPFYMSELAEWQEFFKALADKFHLVREFKENGII